VTRATVPPPAPPPSPALPSTGPVPVARFFDNVGITSSASTGSGNLDGSGYTLSQEALADAGVMPGSVIWRGSASFTWPAAPAGQADNIVASGQTVPVGRSGSVLGLLVTATWGPASGTGTLRYGDGTSQSFTLTAPDWFQPPPEASVPLITMRYRNGPGNSQDDSRLAYVFYARIPLAPGKLLRAIVLPDISGPTPVADSPALHIFAMAVS
jgi:alpha-L-fucosidase 2